MRAEGLLSPIFPPGAGLRLDSKTLVRRTAFAEPCSKNRGRGVVGRERVGVGGHECLPPLRRWRGRARARCNLIPNMVR